MAEVKINPRVERDGNWWLVYVPEVDRWTQARNLAEARVMAADLVVSMSAAPEGDVDIESFTVELPAEVQRRLSEADELRRCAADANHAAAEKSREAARELRSSGMTVRDIGAALDVSYQRAHQLVSG